VDGKIVCRLVFTSLHFTQALTLGDMSSRGFRGYRVEAVMARPRLSSVIRVTLVCVCGCGDGDDDGDGDGDGGGGGGG
jgi:hypothetical protein